MKTLIPYINFHGQCEQALAFYCQCFNGEVVAMMRFGDADFPSPEEAKDKILHAEFKAGGVHFMASDGMPGRIPQHGENITLNIALDDEAEQTAIFQALAQGGQITEPLKEAFWGARFGMLVDRFGIRWMSNCMKPQ
ncbi:MULTISPECIES: VOC family protein [Chromobacterium]|uniref:VOC family protein n=1 Tax=Chromobacterium aquaticum TaxID=467180 RepID=A0ABV8ZWL9_9NEIS|nr:VOC family protein [Chromobacterium aquaticum]MCD5364159.1 VOC family protein [Chromobacterium aquaticum]